MSLKLIFFLIVLAGFSVSVSGQDGKVCDHSLEELALEAALGNSIAQYNLAVEFHIGEKVPQDLTKAAYLWELAVRDGNIGAHNNLGHLNYYGRGIKQNFAEGVRLWRIAATNGFAESQIHLGFAYSDGKYLRIDLVEAFAWATAGKHFAAKEEKSETVKALSEMADEVLSKISPKLSTTQVALAKRRADTYISRYAPRH